jgi:DNA-binding transcriptional LysR family regulator
MYTLVSYYLPEVLNILKANYSDLDINLFQNPTRQIIRDVLNQEVDLGLCGEFDFEAYADKLNWEWLLNEEIVLVVPETHPLASQATVSVNDILDEVFIGYNDLTGIHLNIDAALANKFEKDIQLDYMLKVNEESSAIGLVRSGLGIAFLPLTPYLNLTGVKVIDLADFYVVRNIYLIWNKLVPLTKGARLIRDTILSNNQKIKAMNEFQ